MDYNGVIVTISELQMKDLILLASIIGWLGGNDMILLDIETRFDLGLSVLCSSQIWTVTLKTYLFIVASQPPTPIHQQQCSCQSKSKKIIKVNICTFRFLKPFTTKLHMYPKICIFRELFNQLSINLCNISDNHVQVNSKE